MPIMDLSKNYLDEDDYFQKYSNRTNEFDSLEGVTLSVVAINIWVYQHMMKFGYDYAKRKPIFVSGMCYELLLCLQHALKFEYIPIKGTTWIGSNATNRSIMTGMAADVINGKIDLSISQASMIMLQQPLPNISYLLPTSSGKLAAMFRQPEAHHMRNILVPSFSLSIWMSWAFTWVIIIISLKIIQYVIRRVQTTSSVKNNREIIIDAWNEGIQIENEDKENVLNIGTWCFSTITCQDWDYRQSNISVRALMLISIIFADLICIYYSATLTSILATEEVSITSFKGLAKSHLKIYGENSLPVVRDKIIPQMYEKYRGQNITTKKGRSEYLTYVNKAGSTILNESAAFITFEDMTKQVFEINRTKYYESPNYCNVISSVSVTHGHLPNAMFVKRGSKLKEIFNRKILVMQERGLIYRLNLEYNSNTIIKCPPVLHTNTKLTMPDLSTAFLCVIFGIAVSLFSVLAEKSGLLKIAN